jgi:Zn-dependent peptidase ImmA (M78 family)
MALGEQVNPAVLVWARESAGLDLDEAAHQIGLASPKVRNDRLFELETGARLPTRTQLMKIAKVYRRPLLTFYRNAPPPKGDRGSDFRTSNADVTARENALLDALIRNAKARQEMLASFLEDEDDFAAPQLVGSCSLADGTEKVASRIGRDLKLNDGLTRSEGPEDLFKQLRRRTESVGVFVLLVSNLGSHHSALSEEVFRGCALANKIAPFILINDQDARAARSFTLLHELAHVYLGQSGVSGIPEEARGGNTLSAVESFCNEVAGLILLPSTFTNALPTNFSRDDSAKVTAFVEATAAKWSVSEPLVALRMRRMNLISASVYGDLNKTFSNRWIAQKARKKTENAKREGGPSYYVVKNYSLGSAIIDVTRRALRENRISPTKAATILGVKPSSVAPLLNPQARGKKVVRTGAA